MGCALVNRKVGHACSVHNGTVRSTLLAGIGPRCQSERYWRCTGAGAVRGGEGGGGESSLLDREVGSGRGGTRSQISRWNLHFGPYRIANTLELEVNKVLRPGIAR
jgi:hypothetical protein